MQEVFHFMFRFSVFRKAASPAMADSNRPTNPPTPRAVTSLVSPLVFSASLPVGGSCAGPAVPVPPVGGGVAAVAGPASYAPISHTGAPSALPSTGRGAPRWSVSGQAAPSPPSIAKFAAGGKHASPWQPPPWPGSNAWVRVGPPLSASGPRRSSPGEKSFGPPQVPSVSRFRLLEVTGPIQFAPIDLATMVFFNATVPAGLLKMPPPSNPALLLATVTFVSVVAAALMPPPFTMPPPIEPALFPLIVLLTISSVEAIDGLA